MKEYSLEINNLNFSYSENPVLNDLSFNVEKGDFISILGPNGAGKSTLVNILSKVLPFSNGQIIIEGRDIKSLNHLNIARLAAVVPQYSNIGFNFSVYETIMMGRYPYLGRVRSEKESDYLKVDEVMKLTRTDIFKDRKYNELSGGEKQRVIIAQTLAQDTPIIILDEPTSHLDINFQIEFMELFYELNRNQGKTIIGIFHDINLAIQYSKKIMLLKDGSIYNYGDVNKVINRASIMSVFNSDVYIGKNPFTGKLYVSPNFNFHYELSSLKQNRGMKIHVISGGGAASSVLNIFHNMGFAVTSGVINNLDTDYYTAEMLGIPFVNEAPFSPISEEAYEKNIELIKESDFIILPAIEFGNGNLYNLIAVEKAIDFGKKVIVINLPEITQRDHTNGQALEIYRRIIEKRALAVSDISEAVRALKKAQNYNLN